MTPRVQAGARHCRETDEAPLPCLTRRPRADRSRARPRPRESPRPGRPPDNEWSTPREASVEQMRRQICGSSPHRTCRRRSNASAGKAGPGSVFPRRLPEGSAAKTCWRPRRSDKVDRSFCAGILRALGALGNCHREPLAPNAFGVERSAMIRRAIYPGSFDPVTNGHLDVIDRARKLFDEVIVAVAHNDQKQPLFTLEERLQLLRETLGNSDHVEIAPLDGLLVDFAVARQATAVIRGLRAISDFEFEFQMALMNRKLDASVETIFLMPKEEYTYLSSRIVKEIARLGGNIAEFVPPRVAEAHRSKLAKRRSLPAKLPPSA